MQWLSRQLIFFFYSTAHCIGKIGTLSREKNKFMTYHNIVFMCLYIYYIIKEWIDIICFKGLKVKILVILNSKTIYSNNWKKFSFSSYLPRYDRYDLKLIPYYDFCFKVGRQVRIEIFRKMSNNTTILFSVGNDVYANWLSSKIVLIICTQLALRIVKNIIF